MTTTESAAVIEYSIRARFDEICQQLRDAKYADRRERPIGYWALTGDRRLPYALLERKVGDIISSSFKELAQTPAIGKKKMTSLVMLLDRVRDDRQPQPVKVAEEPAVNLDEHFSPDSVSESHWEAWRETVRRHQLGGEPLGRLAPSLKSLPTVIWDTPLSAYLDMPLAQLRRLKTHGDKRVRNVLEVFYSIHQILGSAVVPRHMTAHLRPSFVLPIEHWIAEAIRREEPPSLQELRQNLILPLLNQIEVDSDENIGRLMAGRLGVENPPESVIEQAERLGVTRARIYQLLEMCSHIVNVRWPEGGWQINALLSRYGQGGGRDETREMLSTLRVLLYPIRTRTEPVREHAMAEEESLAGS